METRVVKRVHRDTNRIVALDVVDPAKLGARPIQNVRVSRALANWGSYTYKYEGYPLIRVHHWPDDYLRSLPGRPNLGNAETCSQEH